MVLRKGGFQSILLEAFIILIHQTRKLSRKLKMHIDQFKTHWLDLKKALYVQKYTKFG